MQKKIISFSLWGDNPKYVVGAIRNAELAEKLYPDWKCRFYVGQHTGCPSELQFLCQKSNVEYVKMPEGMEGWKGMYARFLPASEDDVDVFISRDCDSRLSAREASAVQEWLWSNKLVHSMADHPFHFHPKAALMGGMFGMKRHACPQMKTLIEQFMARYPDAWQCDQDFLRDCVFPLVAHKVYPSSDIHSMCMSIPLPRLNGAFVGEIIGPNEEILHPEHRVIRDQA
jgi:protein O-GlcNAc transferase